MTTALDGFGGLLDWDKLQAWIETQDLLFTAEATAYAVNPVFQFKAVLIAAGILNAIVFELLARRNWRDWENYTVPLGAKLMALLSLMPRQMPMASLRPKGTRTRAPAGGASIFAGRM